MALFKVRHGKELPNTLTDSYGYLLINDDNDKKIGNLNIGEWYVDINNDTETKRYRIVSAALIDNDGNLYTAEDFSLSSNLVEELTTALEDANNEIKQNLRNNMNVASLDSSITKCYSIQLLSSGWTETTQTIILPETLQCGSNNVPPTIIPNGNSTLSNNRALFSLLTKAEISDDKKSITFYVDDTDKDTVLNSNIDMILIDYR